MWTPDPSTIVTAEMKAAQAQADLLATFRNAVQAHIDAKAQERQYDNGLSLATYVTSVIEPWAREAAAFVAWRDLVWGYALTELERVMSGERWQPSIEAFIAELPVLVWPE